MTSPVNTIKTAMLKKPLVIKKESIFKPTNPLLLRPPIKRTTTQVESPVPSPKKSCLSISDVGQSTSKSTIINVKKSNQPMLVNKNKKSVENSSTTLNETTLRESKEKLKKPDQSENLFEDSIILDEHSQKIYKLGSNDSEKPTFFMLKKTSCAKLQRCTKHGPLPEHKAEHLPQLFDIFNSSEEFVEYASEHAKNWFFYYTRVDTRNAKSSSRYNSKKPTYFHFSCRFNKKCYKSQSKGIRRPRADKLAVDCPAGLTLRVAVGEDKCMVWDVCNHHSHELSADIFNTMPHGYRLPKEIKEEIRDLALFNVDHSIATRYIESKVPDVNLRRTVYHIFLSMKNKEPKETMPPERVKDMLAKIKYIKANFSASNTQQIMDDSEFSSEEDMNEPHTATIKGTTSDQSMPSDLPYEQQLVRSMKSELQDETHETPEDTWEGSISEEIENDKVVVEMNDAPTQTGTFLTTKIVDLLQYKLNPNYSKKAMPIIKRAPLTATPPKQYKIGDITIQTTENRNESGNPTVVLLGAEPKKEVTQSQLLTQLSKLEHTIAEPSMLHSPASSSVSSEWTSSTSAETKCQRRHKAMPEHTAEGLVKVDDTFSSIDEFIRYANSQALKWFFYYAVTDSRNVKTTPRYNNQRKTIYYFSCRFDKKASKSRGTGLRKTRHKILECPAKAILVSNPGEDLFRVIYVCHHHSHELSSEMFSREAHGHRLSPEIKEEIRELRWFGLDTRLIRLYLQNKVGIDLKFTIKNVLIKIRQEQRKVELTPEKQQAVLDKIEEIKRNFTIPKRAPPTKKIKPTIEGEKDNIKQNFTKPKRVPSTKKVKQIKKGKKHKINESDDEENKSRVDARLNNILYDQELIQSVKELQESTGCEIHINPWGNANVINKGITDLQDGIDNTEAHELQIPEGEIIESQIEVDQQLYSMDDNVQYIIPSNNDENIIFEVDNTTEVYSENIGGEEIIDSQCDQQLEATSVDISETTIIYDEKDTTQYDESIIYEEKNTTHYDENVVYEKNSTTQYDENVVYEQKEPTQYDENIIYEQKDTTQYDENVIYEQKEPTQYDENIIYEEKATTQCDENVHVDSMQEIEEIKQSGEAYEYSEDNEYQRMYQYTNDDDDINDNTGEHLIYVQRTNETYVVRDAGVQADFEMIELEKDWERVKKLEAIMIKEDMEQSKHSVCTRSRPKIALEEGIINRFNIELYINVGGIVPCLENLANIMSLSVLELLKKLYQGECVFKMTLGRSGKQGRKTLQLTYVPLTVVFSFDRFKYNNGLLQYKNICSKYSDVAIRLEDTIESMSAELTDTKEKLKTAESQNAEFLKVMKNYEVLVKSHNSTKELLIKCQKELSQAKAENEMFLDKIKNLEALQLSSRLKDAEILKQLLEPTIEKKSMSELRIENELLRESLEKKPQVNLTLIEKIKNLEQQLAVSDDEAKRYMEKIKKLEDLYLSDSQSLLDKIKVLEDEIRILRINKSKNATISKSFEEQSIKLRDELKNLAELKGSENKKLTDKIKTLGDTIISLNNQLNNKKQKNSKGTGCSR